MFGHLTMHALAHLVAHAVLWAAAAVSYGQGYTGIRVFVGDPYASWDGTSRCSPCNQVCGDIATRVAGTAYLAGVGERRRDGRENDIAILRALPDEPTPYFEAVRNGRVVQRWEGYRGGIEHLMEQYPGPVRDDRTGELFANYYEWKYAPRQSYGYSSYRTDRSGGARYESGGYGYSGGYGSGYGYRGNGSVYGSLSGRCVNGVCYP